MKTTWKLDAAQSDVQIKMRHSIIAYLAGTVNEFDGHIDLHNDQLENASIAFSLDVNNKQHVLEHIDNSLKMNDLFDVDNYPIIQFQSTSFEKVTPNINFLKGNLTIKNITKPVELDAALVGIAENSGTKKAAFEITANINRKDFGLTYNAYHQSSGLALGQDIKLIANLEFCI